MGRSNWKGQVDMSSKVFFAYPQKDGALLISIEEYDESTAPRKTKTT